MRKIACLIAFAFMLSGSPSEAQMSNPSPLPVVPTVKILAIGKFTGTPKPEQFKMIAEQEVPATVRLFLAGKIDQWYSLQDANGVVFIMNVASVEEAHTLLEALPLGQAKLMTFELIPLGPLRPLALLLRSPDKSAH